MSGYVCCGKQQAAWPELMSGLSLPPPERSHSHRHSVVDDNMRLNRLQRYDWNNKVMSQPTNMVTMGSEINDLTTLRNQASNPPKS